MATLILFSSFAIIKGMVIRLNTRDTSIALTDVKKLYQIEPRKCSTKISMHKVGQNRQFKRAGETRSHVLDLPLKVTRTKRSYFPLSFLTSTIVSFNDILCLTAF